VLDPGAARSRGSSTLLPVFANLLPADAEMTALIDKVRAPYKAKLDEKLAVSEGLLYRRGNFNGSWDQLILDAMLEVKAPRSVSRRASAGHHHPAGPGHHLRASDGPDRHHLPARLERTHRRPDQGHPRRCRDNLFNPDPYYQQGGDMVRVGGLTYACNPNAKAGSRISDMRLDGRCSTPRGNTRLPAGRPSAKAQWRADLGRGRQVAARQESRDAAQAQPAKLVGMEKNPGLA